MNDGDWICRDPNCANINFARRIYCYRCNKDSGKTFQKKLGTEIGKSAADKSRGLFTAEDWHCSKCGNVNWARRQTCNVCNAPKFGEPEARTGYGGGYDERGNVEYRQREPSSDDEYDEFGRRKRKRKDHQDYNQEGTSQSAGDGGDQDKKEEQEEEEESGDEADLAKYDLCGSDDEHANSSKDDAGEHVHSSKDDAGEQANPSKDDADEHANSSKYDADEHANSSKNDLDEHANSSKDDADEYANSSKDDADEHVNSSKNDTGDKSKDLDVSKDTGSESGDKNGKSTSADHKSSSRRSRSSSSSKSNHKSANAPKNKFDELNLNSQRETVHISPKRRKSRSRSPHPGSTRTPLPRKSRDSRSIGESRRSRDKEKYGDHDRRSRSRGAGTDHKRRRYSRNATTQRQRYGGRNRHLSTVLRTTSCFGPATKRQQKKTRGGQRSNKCMEMYERIEGKLVYGEHSPVKRIREKPPLNRGVDLFTRGHL